jgi:hypothetical protein
MGIKSMMYRGLSLACIAVACASAAPALSQTVDFNDLASANTYVSSTPLTEGGFVFDATPGHRLLVWGSDLALYSGDPSGATIATQDAGSTINVSKSGGGVFGLTSIDFDDIYNGVYGMGGQIDLTFHYAVGADTTQSINIDGGSGLETFILNLTGLTSFDIVGTGTRMGLFQMDNLVTTRPAGNATSPAPEPASWAMMLVGFGALGTVLRRRKVSVAFG